MKTKQKPLAGFALVVLNEVHIEASRQLKVQLVEALKEEAAVITKNLGVQNWDLGKIGWVTV